MEVLTAIHLPELLGPFPLAHLQGAATSFKSTIGSGQVWRRSILAGQPCLSVDASLLKDTARRTVLHCYGPLSRSTIGIGDEPLMQSVEEAQRLAKLLRGIEKAREEHLGRGGRVAGILVGRFRLSPCEGAHADKSNIPLGTRHTFRLPKELNEYFGGCPELVVRLGSGQNCLLLRARLDQTPVKKKNDLHQKLLLDVVTASSELIVDYRRAPVNLDRHCCHAMVGMHSFSRRNMACGNDPSPDILCAFFIRDGQPQAWKANLALSLNIDTPLAQQ